MDLKELTIPDLFQESLAQAPQKTALQIKQGGSWQKISYQDLEAGARKVAAFLIQQGFKKGDFIALILENRPQWAVVYLGIMYAGLACVPVDCQLSAAEIRNIISDCQAKAIFTAEDLLKKKISPEVREAVDTIITVEDFSQIDTLVVQVQYPVVAAEDIASLIYTSGTTAQPKGVLLSHRNFISNFLSIKKSGLVTSQDNFIAILPLHHTYPFMATLLVPLLYGATVTFFPSGFKPQDLAGIIKESGGTILAGVPQLFSLLHHAIFEKVKRMPVPARLILRPLIHRKIRGIFGNSLRLLVSGGARLDAKIARDLTEWGFKVIEGYGLTETSPIVTLTPPEKIKFGSAGKAVADVRIKIGHPDASGIGEILIQGPNLMQGYFRKPQETAQAIKEGWFHSGDLGYIDREGYLFITGRDKEVIVLSSGKNIYPEELESYYGQSPYIKEICILQRPQERFGQQADALFAVVVPDLEFFKRRNEVNVEEKIRWEVENLSQKLPPYQHLMGFALSTEELPRTTLKKIRRFLVREKYFKGRARMPRPQGSIAFEELPAGIDPGISRKVLEYLAAQLNKPVSLESHLEIGLGIDSLSRVELGLGLERLFSLKIPQQALYEFSTVKDIILAITQLSGKGTISATVPGAGLEKSWSQILKEEIPQQTLKRIRIKIHFIDWALAWFFKVILGFLLRVFWLLRIEGKNNFPAKGPLLITPSHSSFLDGFVVFCSLPLRLAVNTYFLGYSFIFERPLIRWAIKSLRLIPLDPNANLTEALQAVAFVLRQGKIVCIFPEGRRSVNTRINEFKKGIGILIKELDVPAAPVYIQGSHYAWARTARFPRPYPLKIIIGKSLLGLANTGAYEDIARALQAEVIKLKER